MDEDAKQMIWIIIHIILSVITGGLCFYLLLLIWYLQEKD